jgi:hypothetical protein
MSVILIKIDVEGDKIKRMNKILKPVIAPTKSPYKWVTHSSCLRCHTASWAGTPSAARRPRVLVLCHRRGPERSSGPLASDLPRAANEANTPMTPRVPELPTRACSGGCEHGLGAFLCSSRADGRRRHCHRCRGGNRGRDGRTGGKGVYCTFT